MNNWHNEFMAEYHRQDILAEAEQIRLGNPERRSRVYRPGLFERTMFNFANWMISAGKDLRRRYEIPAPDCTHRRPKSFAH